ncbi:tetratricopeptide repeat protein [Flavobacterium sp. N1994]|uniref:tetratricopeptide repeat-containing sensor histidine kinase n=1 Tax=Flavobacterium sp. N1994 TaxID=2986827 RepID=UPI002223A469|nr:tetratricopeptide repeat protein [Flavobacterium sp. N1994]
MKLKLLFVFLSFSLFVNGQNKAIDSLSWQLTHTKSDIVKAKTLNNLASEYLSTNPKQVLQYATKALQLAKSIGFKVEEGNAYHLLGNANVLLGNYTQALDYFSKSQTIFENELPIGSEENINEIKNGLARAYGSIGYVFMEQSNYDKALQFNFKSLKIFEETNNLKKLARVYNNIGVIYKSQNELFKALVYYEKCLDIQEKLKDENIGTTTSNIGLIYLLKKNYPKAVARFNEAKVYFDKYPNPQGLAQLYYNNSLYYSEINQFAKAIEFTDKALAIFTKTENKFGIANSYANLGEIYLKQKKYDSALEYTNKALVLSRELNTLDKVQVFEKTLSDIYEKQNNISEAYKHYKLYSVAKDSVTNAQTIKNSIRAEMNFDFDRKQMIQKEEQIKKDLVYNEQKKYNQIKVFLSILLSLLLSGIAFLMYNRVQLKKTLTLEKELAVYEQKALHLQMNPHFVFNCLGSISSFIVKNSTDAAIKYLAKFSKLMRLTLEYSKESLIPIDKEIESLENYLELEQLRFNNSFQFKINKCKEIEDDVALPPLLLQPFVENAIIHGMNPNTRTGLITLDFFLENESLVCVVTDNGIGINKSKEMKKNLVSMHKSMALDITKKRLEMMEETTSKKSKVTIEEIQENGKVLGTRVTLVLPLQYLSTI